MLHLAAYPLLVGSGYGTYIDAYTYGRCLLLNCTRERFTITSGRAVELKNDAVSKVIMFIYSSSPSVRQHPPYRDNYVYSTAT